jgi:acetyl esterase/lipase
MLQTTERPGRQTADAQFLHPLIAEDRAVMAALRAQTESFKGTMTGPEAREAYDAIMEQTPDAPGVSHERGAVGAVRSIWCLPRTADLTIVILYLHGGAYVLGSAHAYRHLAGHVAVRANAAAFVADYQRAPEAPFPAALDDSRRYVERARREGSTQRPTSGRGCRTSFRPASGRSTRRRERWKRSEPS